MMKMSVYRALRSQGLRLYAAKSWLRNTPVHVATEHADHRTMSTVVAQRQEIQEEEHVSYVNQMLQRIGFKGGMRYYPEIIQLAGYRLYLSVAEAVMYNNIWKDVNMPDSFQTWHKMTSLHLWMVSTRLRLEGQEGKLARFWMVKGLLDDVKTKTDAVAKEVNLKVQKDDLEILHEQFLTGCMNYDEGILGDDRHLAAAIWRALYHHQPDIDPVHLEIMVHYIRKQVRGLQLISSQDLLVKGLIPFYPLKGTKIPPETYRILEEAGKKELLFKGL